MDSLDRRAFLAGLGALVVAVLGYLLLPGRLLLCVVEDLLLRIDHELLVFSRVDEPTVSDVTVSHPPSGTVTLSDTLHLPAEGQACYVDPFSEDGDHRVTIAVRDGPSESTLAECCLHAGIEAERIEFYTAFE